MTAPSNYFEPTPDDVDSIRLEPFDPTACMVRLGATDNAHFYHLEDVLALLAADNTHPLTDNVIGLQDVRPILTRDNGPAFMRTVSKLVQRGWTGMNEVAMWDAASDGRWLANEPAGATLEDLLFPLRRMTHRTCARMAVMAELMRARPSLNEAARLNLSKWRAHDLQKPDIAEEATLAAVRRRLDKGSAAEKLADAYVGMHERLLAAHRNALLPREPTIDLFLSVVPLVGTLQASPTRNEAAKLLDERFFHAVAPRIASRMYIVNPSSVEQHLHEEVLPRLTADERRQLQGSWYSPHMVWLLLKAVMLRSMQAFREYTPSEVVSALAHYSKQYFKCLGHSQQHRMRMIPDYESFLPTKDPLGADMPEPRTKAEALMDVLDACVENTSLLPHWRAEMAPPADQWLFESD